MTEPIRNERHAFYMQGFADAQAVAKAEIERLKCERGERDEIYRSELSRCGREVAEANIRAERLLAALKQCKTELEEAANLLEAQYPQMASIYRMAVMRVSKEIDEQ